MKAVSVTKSVLLCATLATMEAPAAARADVREGARVVAVYTLAAGEELRGITVDGTRDALWIAGGSAEKVFRVDVKPNSASWTSWDVGRPLAFTVPYGDHVWANSWITDTLFRLDTVTGAIDYPVFPVNDAYAMHGPLGLQILNGVLWVAFHNGAIAKLDPNTMETLEVLPLKGAVNRVIARPDSVWITAAGGGAVYRLDPAKPLDKKGVTMIDVPAACGELAVTDDDAYIAGGGTDCGPPGTFRIDPHTNQVDDAPIYDNWSQGVAVGFGSIWVSDWDRQLLVRIDPATRQVTGRQVVPGLGELAVAFGSLWTITGTGDLIRFDPR